MSDTPSGSYPSGSYPSGSRDRSDGLRITEMPGELVPRPDPTRLTTDIVNAAKIDLRREIQSLRELLQTRIDGVDSLVEVAMLAVKEQPLLTAGSISEAIMHRRDVTDANATRIEQEMTSGIHHLQELVEEKFAAIQQQFDERDVRGEQEKKASKEALDAALLAQKESVSQQNDANTTAATKSETSFTKQIDQIGTLIATLEKSLTDRITELKERIDRGEGSTSGAATQRVGARETMGQWIAGIGLVASIIIGIAIVAVALIVHG